MARSYISIFFEENDELNITENEAGRHNLTIGGDVTIFFGTRLDEFVDKLNQIYRDHKAREEARNARASNGSKGARPEKYPSHKANKA